MGGAPTTHSERRLERSMPPGSGTHLACQYGFTVGFYGLTPRVICRDAPVALPHALTSRWRVASPKDSSALMCAGVKPSGRRVRTSSNASLPRRWVSCGVSS
jgi:hypothetical protein